MKKLLWSVAAATLLFASCATDDAEVVTIPASDDFTATINADSRTVLDGTAVLWEADDALTIFTKTAHNRKYTVKSGANTRSATFGYVGYTGSDATKIASNYAIYPYDATATISRDEIISTTTASEQRYDATKVDLAHSIMVAKSDDNTLSFKNAGALLRFAVSKEDLPEAYTLKTITLVSANNALAGAATIDLADDHKLVVAEDGSKTISLTEINAEITTEAKFFHIALPALDFVADDLAVTFTFEDGTKTFTLPAFELTQNTIKTINYQIKADDFNGSTGEGLSVQVSTPKALQEAVVNPEVSTVVLAADIELTEPLSFGAPLTRAATANEGREFTLDLNGYTISQTKAQTAHYAMIENYGNLTITDNKGEGKISYTDSGNGGNYVSNTISNYGTLTIQGGMIENMSSETVAYNGYPYAIDNNSTTSTATLTVAGGTIHCENYCGIRLFANSTTNTTNVNITAGEVVGGIEFQKPNSSKMLGNLSISGGKVSNKGTKNTIFIFGAGGDASGMTIAVTGGEFAGQFTMSGSFPIGDNFNSKFISGGVFKFDPSAFVAENYRAKEVGDVWQIVNAYELTDEADLFWLAKEVNVNGNDFSGKTFKLMNDVALTKEWEPIGLGSDNYTKTLKADFDGNKKTISNMIVNGTDHVGFFGAKVKGNVTDLYIDKASISGTHYAGGIVGWMHNVAEVGHNAVLNVQGCKVTNSTITLDTDNAPDNGDKIGGIAGFVYLGTVKSCEVANTTIKGYRDCGGIVGYTSDYAAGNYYAVVENNVVGANVKLIVDNDVNYKNYSKQSDYDFDHIIGEACALTQVSGNTGTVTIDWGQISAE
ncbi:MAG: hypothetical protein IKU77_05220 [Alistipes sp.]|nr:hypothetical protein [Alistipes sp.]